MNMNDNLEIPSSDDSNVIKFGLSVIIIVFGILGGWMAFAPLASSSVAAGIVSAGDNKKTVQYLENGIINKIFIKDGQKVKKNDLLLKLRDIEIKSELEIIESRYYNALGVYARLIAQNNDQETIAFSDLLKDEKIKSEQISILKITNKLLKDEKIIGIQRVTQLNKQISGMNSLIEAKKKRKVSLKDEIEELKVLYKEKLVDKQRIRDIQREESNIDGELLNKSFEIARFNEQINESKTKFLYSQKEFKTNIQKELVDTKKSITEWKLNITTLKDRLARTEIIAPIDGTVVGFKFNTIGEFVNSGEEIMQILPLDSKLIVKVQVTTSDIDKVKVGLLSDIRFSAFNLQQAHVVEGKVARVSADSFINESNGENYYEADIEVTEEGLKQLKEYEFILVAGMPAEVMINIGNRTPLSYLIKPFKDMVTRGFNEE